MSNSTLVEATARAIAEQLKRHTPNCDSHRFQTCDCHEGIIAAALAAAEARGPAPQAEDCTQESIVARKNPSIGASIEWDDECHDCLTLTHCTYHRRCLAACTPHDLVPPKDEAVPNTNTQVRPPKLWCSHGYPLCPQCRAIPDPSPSPDLTRGHDVPMSQEAWQSDPAQDLANPPPFPVLDRTRGRAAQGQQRTCIECGLLAQGPRCRCGSDHFRVWVPPDFPPEIQQAHAEDRQFLAEYAAESRGRAAGLREAADRVGELSMSIYGPYPSEVFRTWLRTLASEADQYE